MDKQTGVTSPLIHHNAPNIFLPPYDHPALTAYPTSSNYNFRLALFDLQSALESYVCEKDRDEQKEGNIKNCDEFESGKRMKRQRISDINGSHDERTNYDRCCLRVDSDTICIYDKYPKAKYHVLLIPKKSHAHLGDVNGLENLTPQKHLTALKKFHKMGRAIADAIRKQTKNNVRMMMGYHSVPSLYPLHLHIISDDIDSVCVKVSLW